MAAVTWNLPFLDLNPILGAPLSLTAEEVDDASGSVEIRVTDRYGNVHTYLNDASIVPGSRVQTLNQPWKISIKFPKYRYTREQVHLLTRDLPGGPLHYIRVLVNGKTQFVGLAVGAPGVASDSGDIVLECEGIDAALHAQTLDGPRQEYLQNEGFETGDLSYWFDTNGLSAAVDNTDAQRGTYSAVLVGDTTDEDAYIEQAFDVTGTGVGTLVTLAAWFKVVSITGRAHQARGLFIQGSKDGVLRYYDFYPIDTATPTGEWIRAKVTLQVPPLETWRLHARLYKPNGTIRWDATTAVPMDSISTAGLTGVVDQPADISRIMRMLYIAVQSPTLEKYPLHVGLDCDLVGIEQVKHFQYVNHTVLDEQLREWIERDDIFDYVPVYHSTSQRMQFYTPRLATDRTAQATLLYSTDPARVANKNVAKYEISEDAWRATSRSVVYSDNDGPDRDEGEYIDTSLTGGLVLHDVRPSPPLAEIGSLDALARERVQSAPRPVKDVVLTLFGRVDPNDDQSPFWKDYIQLGDLRDWELEDGWASVSGTGRVVQLTPNDENRTVEVVLNEEPA